MSNVFLPVVQYSPCRYHSTIAPYSFIHLPPILYNVFSQYYNFPTISIIPPFLHTHSSTYLPLCVMFFSQYFSIPFSVSFHHSSIYILLPTTHTLYFSFSTSEFSCQYHSTIAPYTFMNLTPTLYNVFLPVLQFPLYHSTISPYPFIQIPPTLYNVFLPVHQISPSVSFHHFSIPIYPPTTDAV